MHDFVFSLRNSKLILLSNPKIISFNTVFFSDWIENMIEFGLWYRKQESIMLEHVRKSHPNLREPLILELDKSMPTLQEIQTSWCKFRDTCCTPTDNAPKFWEQDAKFLSLLNNSRWPHHVMYCLRIANRVVETICYHQVSVVLQGFYFSLSDY